MQGSGYTRASSPRGMVATPLALNATSVSRAWRKYNVSLRTSPLATKAVTCMAAYAVGDLTAQIASSKAQRLDRRLAAIDVSRTTRMALYGLLWCGPACHAFYSHLDRVRLPRSLLSLIHI